MCHSLSFLTTKLPVGVDPVPKACCKACLSVMAFVAQISSPVASFNRTFYLFGCNNAECKEQDWKLWRVVSPCEEGEVEEQTEVKGEKPAEENDWGASAWGATDSWSATPAPEPNDSWGIEAAKEDAGWGSSDWPTATEPAGNADGGWGTGSGWGTEAAPMPDLKDLLDKRDQGISTLDANSKM